MGIFQKKNKEETPVVEKTSQQAQSTVVKSGKKAGLKTVLHESVVATALDMFSSNKPFVTEYNGDTAYVGLMLRAEDIGGLSTKDNKDEAKGTIIECLNAGRIKSYTPAAILADDKMVIIPDAMTLDTMSEFSLLEKAPYTLCYVDTDGSVFPTEKSVTFADAVRVAEEELSIDELLGEDDTELVVDEEEEPAVDIPEEVFDEPVDADEPVDVDFAGDDDIMDDDDVQYDDIPEEEIPADDEIVEDDGTVMEPVNNGDDEFEGDDDGYVEQSNTYESEPVDDVEISEEEVDMTVRRRFYSGDLGLEVSTEPFDAQFMTGNPYVPFEENRPEGWLNEYLNQMSRDANVEMERMHSQNLFTLRERYFTLVSMHCDKIQKELDVRDPETVYGKQAKAIDDAKSDSLASISDTANRRKDDMNRRYKDRMDAVADEAAAAARRQFTERYGRSHEDELMRVESIVMDEIDQKAENDRRELYAKRREEAAKLLDMGINATLQTVAEMYEEMVVAEQTRYRELNDNMLRFVEQNRTEEISRTNALRRELDQKQKADEVMEEFRSRISLLNEEFEGKKLQYESDINRMRDETESKLRNKDVECQRQLDDMRRENEELRGERQKLMDQYAELDSKKNAEYSERIARLEQDKTDLSEQMNRAIEQNRKSNRVAIFTTVIALIAALAIGVLGGYYGGAKLTRDLQSLPPAQTQQVQQEKQEQREQTPAVENEAPQTSAVENEAPQQNATAGN